MMRSVKHSRLPNLELQTHLSLPGRPSNDAKPQTVESIATAVCTSSSSAGAIEAENRLLTLSTHVTHHVFWIRIERRYVPFLPAVRATSIVLGRVGEATESRLGDGQLNRHAVCHRRALAHGKESTISEERGSAKGSEGGTLQYETRPQTQLTQRRGRNNGDGRAHVPRLRDSTRIRSLT